MTVRGPVFGTQNMLLRRCDGKHETIHLSAEVGCSTRWAVFLRRLRPPRGYDRVSVVVPEVWLDTVTPRLSQPTAAGGKMPQSPVGPAFFLSLA